MATFEAKVYRLKIEEHPNADALELARVGDYRSIVRKGQFQTGDLGVYIPEAAVLPEWLISELGLEGRLAGKDKNRVKAVRLRGTLSQGLVYPVTDGAICRNGTGADEDVFFVEEGDVVTDFLGITKYEPPIPVHMAGEVFNAHGKTLKYDIENAKKFPGVLIEGEEVIMTEKIHGTFILMGYHPDITHPIVTSKGLSDKGLAFKMNEANKDNLYIRTLNGTMEEEGGDDVVTRLRRLRLDMEPFYILGEVYGKGVQDLTYGADKPQFRAFDIYVGEPGHGRYLDTGEFRTWCRSVGLEMVPVLYEGPFSKEKMLELTDGKEVVSGSETNIREGLVIKPWVERENDELGRVILKSVSEAYLLRKGGTEFN